MLQTINRHLLICLSVALLCLTALPLEAAVWRLPSHNQPTAVRSSHSGRQQIDKRKGQHGKPRFNFEQFKRDLQGYITREAGLNPTEATHFFPVFFEMKAKTHNLERQKGRALRQAAKENMNDRDCQRILAETIQLNQKVQRIEADYQQRLTHLIGPKKMIKVLHADRRFGRKMFRQMTKK